ncbi:MAG: C39 family peptidase [Deltaproteobacteria bacterium]|nr:C39 family peptidase [Deltaproteobacteria bacterium]
MPPIPRPGTHPRTVTTTTVRDTRPAVTSSTGTASVVRAPDGLEISAPAPRGPVSLSRAEVVAAARRAGVPQRVQIGPTCGLYALGMVMDAWHAADPRHPTVAVQDADFHGMGRNLNYAPTRNEGMLDYARQAGFTAAGEMFTASQLAQVASHFGYTASVHDHSTLDELYRVLDGGHPAIVAFDVDHNGNPGDYDGMRAHYAVIEGYFDEGGERFLVARHGWGVEQDHVWRAADFARSWQALEYTDYYGTPGDGVVPARPELGMPAAAEPGQMHLPDVGGGRAGIAESLALKIVEVVPKGEQPKGGTVVTAPR